MTIAPVRPDTADVLADAPDLEPESNRRAHVRLWRREIAAWLRAHGVAAHGAAWDAAVAGERDPWRLRTMAADDPDGGALVRRWSGDVPPRALVAGDGTTLGTIIGAPVVDPETGRVWITARRPVATDDHGAAGVGGDVLEHDLAPGVPVHVVRTAATVGGVS